MDATKDDQIAGVMARCEAELGEIDFLLHSIAFAPPEDLPWRHRRHKPRGFKVAMEICAYTA